MTTNPMESQSATMIEEVEAKPQYLDFEPYCAWHREEESDTLAVHLHDFQKEQMKVLLSNQRVLKIEGQRPLASDNTWTRFSKQIKLPDSCDERGIRAKLSAGVLTITMPKKLGQRNVSTEGLQQVYQPYHGHDAEETSDRPINNEEHKISDQMANQEAKNGLKDLGLWTMAGKVAAVVIVIAFSGALVHGIYKRRSYNADK